jgi:chromosome segregation ATPase
MSIQSILSNISRLQRDTQSLQSQLSSEHKKVADKTGRIAQIKKSITKSTSASTLQSKQREIQNLESDIVKAQEKQAGLSKRIAEKTTQLHKNEQQLNIEREKEQKNS